jgi:hypothetical protein
VKDALAYLEYLANPADSRSVRRTLRRPARNKGGSEKSSWYSTWP